MRIDSGTGNCQSAKVDNENKLHTRAVTETELTHSVIEGDGYNINTGIITLTNDTDTPILYLKNNELRPLHITAIIVGLNFSTGGSATDMGLITLVRNPTAGTIVSGATDADISANRHFGSTNTLTADAYKGATGDTMTDGTDYIYSYQNDGGRLFLGLDEHLPKGASIGVKLQAPSGNTSMACYVAVVCHLQEEDI